MRESIVTLKQAMITAVCFGVMAHGAMAGDWLMFRGNQGNGLAEDIDGPKTLDNLVWTAELMGRGLSAPVIVGDKVILTNNSGAQQERLHVTCLDRATGKELWSRQYWATGSKMSIAAISLANPSPACDGERVVAFFSSNDLACLDLEGNLLWYRGLGSDFPNASNSLGMSSSPIIVDGTVIVQLETDDDSLAMGLDVSTGETKWKLDRPHTANWSSPVLLKDEAGENVVGLQGMKGFVVVRPTTGETVWSFDGGAANVPSPTVAGNMIYLPRRDLLALEIPKAGAKPKHLWIENRLGPKTASPVVYKGKIYSVNDAGVLVCADATTGKIRWRQRLTGPFSGSPIAAADCLYFFNEAGLGQIVKLDEKKGEILSTRDMGEGILSTPALVDGELYIRSDKHLWKFAN